MAQPQPSKPTRYRVWWIPQIPIPAFYYEVPDVEFGRTMLDVLAKYDLFQYENNVTPDYAYANVGGIQRRNENENEWEEVNDDEDE